MSDQTAEVDTTIAAARQSFSGRSLTDSQFQEGLAITSIVRGEILRSGSFHEKLTDYSHAFARNERFDAMRGETILRDLYKGRYGETMNETREGLLAAEKQLPENAQARALTCAENIVELIQAPPTQPFYQAQDRAAVTLANELKISQIGAKALMKEAYQTAHGRDLYEASKEIEEAYHKPVREAEIASRKAEKLQTRSQQQSMG